ncbi:hypothetical protein GCM10028784_29770 [Myceligenerans cantabricum]
MQRESAVRRREVLDQVPMRDRADDAPLEARDGQQSTTASSPIPVRVWLKNPRGGFQADGEALSWTSTQVRVRYIDIHGREGWAWVWASAVTRR